MTYCVAYKFAVNAVEDTDEFITLWSGVTAYLKAECGALGSRLHAGEAGVFHAYAQWPSRATLDASRAHPPTEDFMRLQMRWVEICAPSEVIFEGDVIVDLFK